MGFGDDCAGDELEYGGWLSGRRLVGGQFEVKDKVYDAGER